MKNQKNLKNQHTSKLDEKRVYIYGVHNRVLDEDGKPASYSYDIYCSVNGTSEYLYSYRHSGIIEKLINGEHGIRLDHLRRDPYSCVKNYHKSVKFRTDLDHKLNHLLSTVDAYLQDLEDESLNIPAVDELARLRDQGSDFLYA